MAATCRATRQRAKVPLLTAPDGKQVAVVPSGSQVRGVVEVVDQALWLRLDLAKSNPLRVARKDLLQVWAPLQDKHDGAPLFEWEGPLEVELVGPAFQARWTSPAEPGVAVVYSWECRVDGGDWHLLWTGAGSVSEEYLGRSGVAVDWPHSDTQRATARLVASFPGVPSSRLTSAELPVSPGLAELRRLDKGVPHMRKTRSELAILVRKSQKAGGADPDQLAQIEELSKELRAAQEARARILRCARPYVARALPEPCAGKRIALGAGKGTAPPRGRPRPYAHALVMGLYHSCTNAMHKELGKRFEVEVLNDWHTGKDGALWKHRVNERELVGVAGDCLVILMVKEPCFWLKSCCREPRNFFELQPFREGPDGQRLDILENQKTLQDLFGPLEHDAVIYPDAISLWRDTIRSYLDDSVYSPSQAVVVRSEDFLFRFHDVMDELGAAGLREREPGTHPEPLAERAKGHLECRTRDQALAFYANGENRTSGFSAEQLDALNRGLDPRLLSVLGYDGPDPVASWIR